MTAITAAPPSTHRGAMKTVEPATIAAGVGGAVTLGTISAIAMRGGIGAPLFGAVMGAGVGASLAIAGGEWGLPVAAGAFVAAGVGGTYIANGIDYSSELTNPARKIGVKAGLAFALPALIGTALVAAWPKST